ncbi:MAX gene-associated protein [Acanthochromis polyacanthus]|uniref:MAX gene-associated protein n=1 Tax=Acanthochromis polyacanthus TaxID=80966 RepID=UPI002234D923|nr:MAX gene-associated protein [Acanthochromis polyacanthus]
MSDSELASMEGSLVAEDESGSFSIPSSAPSFPATARHNFSSEAGIESKAVSVASHDFSSALSSPAEASPAKPAATSTSEISPATSCIASASDSLTCSVTSLTSESWVSSVPSTTFGTADLENNFPAVLTFKGISVTLENNSVWKQFYSCGTEMILTKQGRRMFPYCRYRLAGLDPDQQYNLVLSIVPSGQYRYRWSTSKWEIHGPAEHQSQGLIRAFSHHYSPCRGSEWMSCLVSFYKLKLTNNSQDQDGHIILHSMHRYIPRLHVIPVLDGNQPTADKPVVMGPESMTFTFPQTEFMAVTTYQNFRITQLKINHNPFAKGFREDGHNPRLQRVSTEAQPVVKTEPQESDLQPAEEPKEDEQEAVDLSTRNSSISACPSNAPEVMTRLVLKPIMSNASGRDRPFVPCIRGRHALGELVLVEKREEPKEEPVDTSVTPEAQRGLKIWTVPTPRLFTPVFSTSTPGSSPRYCKRRKRINRRWANSRGREWKAMAASPTVAHSPSSTVAMQPELDDVEGLLFVSFTSKEALEGHVRDKSASSPASPISLTTPKESKQTSERLEVEVEVTPETDEEKIARLEAVLLNDLRLLKHRQVIHPVLQEVGLKLSSLDPSKSIDLQYLGVLLPLPPPSLPEQNNTAAPSPGDEGLTFISRTGKTSDVTKIKGWKNKFIRSKETSPSNSEASQKNLSAFCSNMLDEYLENEAQQISERAAAFSTDPEGSVSYQLPAKSSSYVKTLDSILKQQNAASRLPFRAIRPCPLSHKPLLYYALTSPPPLTSPEAPKEVETESRPQSASSNAQPAAASASSCTAEVSQRSPVLYSGYAQRQAMGFGLSHSTNHKSSGLTKCQLRLLQMEMRAMKEGVNRTQLTPDRLSTALSVVLTKQMTTCQVSKVVPFPNTKPVGPECGQAFCRLGCVCSSLRHPIRGLLHCRRPECMFDCTCFKRQVTKQEAGSEPQSGLAYFTTNMGHAVQVQTGSQVNKLWNRKVDSVDPDPLYTPTSSPLCVSQMKVPKRIIPPRPTPPICEEKDPVYKYLESMMTCARVRAFNSKPPPEVTMELEIPAAVTTTITTAAGSAPSNTAAKPQTSADNPQKSSVTSVKKAGTPAVKTSQEASNTSGESDAKKQIQIQSACQWKKDRTMVLEALCERMNQNQLSQRFYVGPYCISPVARIFMKKPSGSIITYRVLISKPSKASDYEEDELDDSDQSSDEDVDPQEEDEQVEKPIIRFGVTPFLSGVIPAGRLRARRKPAGCQAQGLIQVNGKSYNQARLLLGNMGSLHPANRLAAFVTGRLHTSGDASHKNSQKPNSSQRSDLPGAPYVKAAGSVVPPLITARKTTDLKIPAQPPVQSLQRDSWKKGPVSLSQTSQNSSSVKPAQSLVSSSSSSPVSLTVSPALKSPSFLGQSGTYSFRICPPSNQASGGQKLPGVTLPGGFTLIQLPKPRADGADSQQSEPQSTTNTTNAGDVPPQKEGAVNFSRLAAELISLNTQEKVRRLLSSKTVESGSSEPICEEKTTSDESDEANGRKTIKQEDSSINNVSEDFSSDSSDYSGDEEDRLVDIETVDERPGTDIAKMRASLHESRDSSDGFGPVRAVTVQDQHEESINRKKRKNHSVLERQRRSELRFLFDKLQIVLQIDPSTPRLQLLSLANKEIQHLVKTSKCLEERKEMLTKMQTDYVKMLSTITGKSEPQILDKLKRICERQKGERGR